MEVMAVLVYDDEDLSYSIVPYNTNEQTTLGLEWEYDRLFGFTTYPIYQMGVGDGTVSPDKSDTDLSGTNKFYKDISLSKGTNPIPSGDQMLISVTFGANEAIWRITESVISVGDATDNFIIARALLEKPVQHRTGSTLTITWKFDQTAKRRGV